MLADFPSDGSALIRIRVAGALVVVSEREMVRLLGRDPALWAAALRRGKAVTRAQTAQRRREGGERVGG